LQTELWICIDCGAGFQDDIGGCDSCGGGKLELKQVSVPMNPLKEVNMEDEEFESIKDMFNTNLETWFKQFNDGLSKYENDDYLSKKHLLDYVDGSLDILIKRFGLKIHD
jgi:hypothetical protein